MATVKTGGKINFYKFVDPKGKSISSSQTRENENAETQELQKVQVKQIESINNIGEVLNGISKSLIDLKATFIKSLAEDKKNRKKFEPRYTEGDKKKGGGLGQFVSDLAKGKTPGFIESILGLLGSIFKFFVVSSILKWMSDPKNRKKLQTILETVGKVAKFIYEFAKFGVVNTIEGLYKLFSDETPWWEKILGLGQALVGIGTLLLGIRWLSNPIKIITDFGNVLKFFRRNLLRSKGKLRGRLGGGAVLAGAALFTAGAVIPAVAPETVQDDADKQADKAAEELGSNEAAAKALEEQQANRNLIQQFSDLITGAGAEREEQIHRLRTGKEKVYGFTGEVEEEEPEKKSYGGRLKKYARGGKFLGDGWTTGPQSGYPVSFGSGKVDAEFHGTERTLFKPDGSAFVIPYDTPATRANPGLTKKREGEAKRLGYSQGGLIPKFDEIFSGFQGRTSKSDVHLVRTFNELTKAIYVAVKHDEKRLRIEQQQPRTGNKSGAGSIIQNILSAFGIKAPSAPEMPSLPDIQGGLNNTVKTLTSQAEGFVGADTLA